MSTSIPTERAAAGTKPTNVPPQGWRTMWWFACAAGAPLLLALTAVFILFGALVGFHPFWREHELNLAEAAALRDNGMIAQLITEGRNPNERLYVRPGMLISGAVNVTPIEAAVGARRLEVVQLLLANGASLDESGRRSLMCLARRSEADDIVEYLIGLGMPDVADCNGVKMPW